MVSEKLSYAIQLIKAGNKQAALPILKEIIQTEPGNENAWLWLYSCVDRPEQKKYCLQQALKINPSNQNARQALSKLSGQVQTTSTPTASSQVQSQSGEKARPVSNVSESPHKAQKSNSNRTLLFAGGLVFILLCCIGGGVLGWNFLSSRFFSQNEYTYSPENPINPGHSGETWSQVGVFLLENGSSIPLPNQTREPAENVPTTYNRSPIFVLNDPQISLPDLAFKNYYNGRLRDDVVHDVYEDGGAYRVEVNTSLPDGVYCFAQYGASVAPGQAMMWCFQIGDNVVLEPTKPVPTPTATLPPTPEVRIVPITYQKNPHSYKDGWEVILSEIAVENYSTELLHYEVTSAKLSTAQGFEYECYGAKATHLGNTIIPSYFRIPFNNFACEVPNSSTGYLLTINYILETDGIKWETSSTVDISQSNPDLSYPLISWDKATNYSQKSTIVIAPEQTIEIFDITLSFYKKSTGEMQNDTPVGVKIKNNYIGGDTKVSFWGGLYFPDGRSFNCGIGDAVMLVPFLIGPGLSGEYEPLCGYISPDFGVTELPPRSCYQVFSTKVNGKVFDSRLMVCFP